jgi:hypothetical protein
MAGCALAAVGLGLALAAGAGDGPVVVREAWVADAPPVVGMTAAYLTLENRSAGEQALVGASSPAFARVEVHRTELREGIARMTPVDRLPLPPGEVVRLEPGGYHLMLIRPASPLAPGATVPLTLELADGERLEVTATVRATHGAAGHDRHDHHHGHAP